MGTKVFGMNATVCLILLAAVLASMTFVQAATTTTPAPTTSTPAPTTSTPAPTTSTPAPTTSTPAPTTSTPAPTTSTPAPTSSTGVSTTPACVDKSTPSECASWANSGYCFDPKYSAYVKGRCCLSCRGRTTTRRPTTESQCHDSNSDCGDWVKQGLCTGKYSEWMKKTCCKACSALTTAAPATTQAPCPDGGYREKGKCEIPSGGLTASIKFELAFVAAFAIKTSAEFKKIAIKFEAALTKAVNDPAKIVHIKVESIKAAAKGTVEIAFAFVIKAKVVLAPVDLEANLNILAKLDAGLIALKIVKDQKIKVSAGCGEGKFFGDGKCQESLQLFSTQLRFTKLTMTAQLLVVGSVEFMAMAAKIELAVFASIKIKFIASVRVTSFEAGSVKANMDINVDPKAPIGAVPPKDLEDALKKAAKEDPGLKALGVDPKTPIVVEDTVCADTRLDCANFKKLCSDPDFKSLLVGQCDRTCNFCKDPCRDKRKDCKEHKFLCDSPVRKVMVGYCDKTCNFCGNFTSTSAPTTTAAPCAVKTSGGNAGGACCVFPFKYEGKEHNTCTLSGHDQLWCGTTYEYKSWGNCKTDPCGHGQYVADASGTCLTASLMYQAEVVVESIWNPKLEIKTSAEFLALSLRIETAVMASIRAKGLGVHVAVAKVHVFFEGSVKALIDLLLKAAAKPDSVTPKQLQDALKDAIDNDPILKKGQPAPKVAVHAPDPSTTPGTKPSTTPGTKPSTTPGTSKSKPTTPKGTDTTAKPGTTAAPCIKTKAGNSNGACCTFPFFYKGKYYNNCTTVDYHTLWCGTQKNITKWGVCIEPVNECKNKGHDCDPNADCVDKPLGYKCVCKPGYLGCGTACRDDDECADNKPNKCSKNAYCTNTVGSYSCRCKPGYTGIGTFCINDNECTNPNICPIGAKCTDTEGGYKCDCKKGYKSNGTHCADEDECKLGTSNCDKNATCVNSDGGFNCTCKKGFIGCGVACRPKPSADDGNWGPWGAFTVCSKPCGVGVQSRLRVCNNPAKGKICPGPPQQDRFCNVQACGVDGNWGAWSGFGVCSKQCGIGLQTRTRRCDNPAPKKGGVQCPGPDKEDTFCKVKDCGVNGNWGPWGPFSMCSKPCGNGIQLRTRACNNPPPANGGAACFGKDTDEKSCNVLACPGVVPVWKPWGPCSAPCGGGQQSRLKVCGLTLCPGASSVETRKCNPLPCPGAFNPLVLVPAPARGGVAPPPAPAGSKPKPGPADPPLMVAPPPPPGKGFGPLPAGIAPPPAPAAGIPPPAGVAPPPAGLGPAPPPPPRAGKVPTKSFDDIIRALDKMIRQSQNAPAKPPSGRVPTSTKN